MDIYELKFTNLQLRIFRLLCIKADIALNQRNISKMLNVSPTAVAKSLPLLEEEGLISVTKDVSTKIISVSLNRNNQKTIQLKRIENLKLIYESGLASFLEEKFPSVKIILFGSYSLGEDISISDIDIAIIGAKEKTINLSSYETMLERKIHLHNYEDINKIKHELKQSILNGIQL